jgi:hypothetical protein
MQMEKARKPYLQLSVRQKRRRRQSLRSTVAHTSVTTPISDAQHVTGGHHFEEPVSSAQDVPVCNSTNPLLPSHHNNERSEGIGAVCINKENPISNELSDCIYTEVTHQSDSKLEGATDGDDSHGAEELMRDSILNTEDKIEAAVINWTVDCPNVPTLSVTKLLHNLSEFFPGLALTANTLTAKDTSGLSYQTWQYGRYVHLENWPLCLKAYIQSLKEIPNAIKLIINVDGIPMFNDSRKHHAYPILIKILKCNKIICSGIYLSENELSNKMPQVNLLLEKTVLDIKKLKRDGIVIGNTCHPISVLALVTDAVARAELKCIVNHNSYNSCERCIQKGEYSGGHVILPCVDAPKRTNASFSSKSDIFHHKPGVTSIFEELNVGLVSDVPLDYMHLVCLGITKKLMVRLKSSKKHQNKCHLSSENLDKLERNIRGFSKHIPSEFSRRLSGGMHSVSFWKAAEFRLVLLYIGIVVLKDVLPVYQYNNFLYLSMSMRLLLVAGESSNILSIEKMLKNFVQGSRNIYGDSFLSYNVHSVIHLVDDYLKFGPLDNISCFPFENYLGMLKERLTGRNRVLEQLVKHLNFENARVNHIKHNANNSKGTINIGQTVYKAGTLGSKDNGVFLKSGELGIIKSIVGDLLQVDIYSTGEYFTEPVKSSATGVFVMVNFLKSVKINVNAVHSKLMILPKNDLHVAIVLILPKIALQVTRLNFWPLMR